MAAAMSLLGTPKSSQVTGENQKVESSLVKFIKHPITIGIIATGVIFAVGALIGLTCFHSSTYLISTNYFTLGVPFVVLLTLVFKCIVLKKYESDIDEDKKPESLIDGDDALDISNDPDGLRKYAEVLDEQSYDGTIFRDPEVYDRLIGVVVPE